MKRIQTRILWIGESDPWSPWCLSGISNAICQELRKRGLLYGAIGVDAFFSRFLHGVPSWLRIIDRINRRVVIDLGRTPCYSENKGVLARVLNDCPPDTVVIYALSTPTIDDSLPIQRFRWMDLSVRDATSLGVFGHSAMSENEIDAKLRDQKRFLEANKGVVTLSTLAADHIAEETNYPRTLITPIGAGPAIDFKREPSTELDRYIRGKVLFVGRDWKRKRGDLLVDALRIVRRHIPQTTLTVVGISSRPVAEQWIEYVPPLDKSKANDCAKLSELFLTSSVFCMPSICEPWGLVYVESSKAGMPIVGFRQWALPDIVVDGETGFLAEDENPRDLAQAMISALKDPKRLRDMGQASKERVREVLDWPHVVDRLLYRVLPEALNGREPRWMQKKEEKFQLAK